MSGACSWPRVCLGGSEACQWRRKLFSRGIKLFSVVRVLPFRPFNVTTLIHYQRLPPLEAGIILILESKSCLHAMNNEPRSIEVPLQSQLIKSTPLPSIGLRGTGEEFPLYGPRSSNRASSLHALLQMPPPTMRDT